MQCDLFTQRSTAPSTSPPSSLIPTDPSQASITSAATVTTSVSSSPSSPSSSSSSSSPSSESPGTLEFFAPLEEAGLNQEQQKRQQPISQLPQQHQQQQPEAEEVKPTATEAAPARHHQHSVSPSRHQQQYSHHQRQNPSDGRNVPNLYPDLIDSRDGDLYCNSSNTAIHHRRPYQHQQHQHHLPHGTREHAPPPHSPRTDHPRTPTQSYKPSAASASSDPSLPFYLCPINENNNTLAFGGLHPVNGANNNNNNHHNHHNHHHHHHHNNNHHPHHHYSNNNNNNNNHHPQSILATASKKQAGGGIGVGVGGGGGGQVPLTPFGACSMSCPSGQACSMGDRRGISVNKRLPDKGPDSASARAEEDITVIEDNPVLIVPVQDPEPRPTKISLPSVKTKVSGASKRLDSVLGSFATYARLKGRYDDDWIDRLNHLYTTIILIIFTIVVSTKQYVGEPIHCWCPAQFEESHVDYTNNVCWVSNTFFIHFRDQPPWDFKLPFDSEVQYYQWVPMILLFQALLFKVPCILWRILTASAGVNLDKIVTLAAETAYVAPDDRDRTIKHIVRYMDRWIENAREYRSGCFIRIRQQISKYCCIVWGKRYGNYLVTLYMIIKLLYLANAIGQLFILNEFLGTDFNVYGFEVMDHLARGESWSESPRFPRITHCFFKIRQMTNVHDYTVQCVLPINLFNEKIFIFIWFWLVFVATLSAFNFLIWTYTMIFRQHRLRYLKKFLRINDCYKSELDKKMAVKFCEQYLRQDGIFVLRLVGKNANDVLVSELILQLWNHYRNKPLFRHANQISDDNSNV